MSKAERAHQNTILYGWARAVPFAQSWKKSSVGETIFYELQPDSHNPLTAKRTICVLHLTFHPLVCRIPVQRPFTPSTRLDPLKEVR